MSGLECEVLRSYADGLLADPEHPFVELLRGQGLVVGDTSVPHRAALLQAFSQATKVLTAWVVDPTEYPSLEGESWRLLATSEEVCEVRASVEFTDLHPDEMPLLASADGEFWAVTAPSSRGCSGKISRMFSPSSPTPEPQISQSENVG